MANKDCEKVLDLLNEYIDGELDAADTEFVRSHIEGCPECRAVLEELKKLEKLFDSEKTEVPAELFDRVMDEVRAEKPKIRKPFIIRKWGMIAVAAVICLSILSTPTLLMLVTGGAKEECADNAIMADADPSDMGTQSTAEKANGGYNRDELYSAEADASDEIVDAIDKVETYPETFQIVVDSGEYSAHMLDGSTKMLILDTENLTAKLDGKEYKLTVSGFKYIIENGETLTFAIEYGDFTYFIQTDN